MDLIKYKNISKYKKLPIIYGDKKNFKNLYNQHLDLNGDVSLNINKLSDFLEQNIFNIEKLTGKVLKNIFIIIQDEKVFNLVSKLNEGSFTEPIEIDEYVNIFYLERIIATEESLDIEIEKEKIINKKKEEKLKLFSSSHFANLESSLKISFL